LSSESASEKTLKEKVTPSKEEPTEEPILLTYRVKKGDTLKKIAAKFGVSVSELKRLNHLKNNKLLPNQKIIIGKIIHPTPAPIPLREDFTYHTVKKGETLYRISLAYNVPLEELKRINHLEGNLISVGQKLKIPLSSSIPDKPFVLESPKKTLEVREENLKEKFERTIIAKNKILTPSMLSKEEELALRQKFIELSKNLADSRYKFGGSGNGYLDCSAFVKLVYEELGIKLPRSSPQQFQVGIPVEREDLIPGDLVFFKTIGKRISHVGIYLGDNRFIHISSSTKRISIDSLDDPYFKSRYAGAKRILNGEVLEYFQDYLKKNSNNSKSQENTETSFSP
ncbi:MAG: LysM peptidoglycan-binding domain-containing protein, partial [Caldimicrobium sp.]